MGHEGGVVSRENEGPDSSVRRATPCASDEPSAKAIERAATQIARARRHRSIASAREIGAIIMKEIYRDNVEAFRSRTAKDESLRRLASHPKLGLSAATLWRAVGVFLITERMPGFREPKHVELGHLYAVLGLTDEQQQKLLRVAEVEQWPRSKLEAKVATLRPARGTGPARPAILRHAASLERVATTPLPALDSDLSEESLVRIETALAAVERRANELRAWLAAARHTVPRVSR